MVEKSVYAYYREDSCGYALEDHCHDGFEMIFVEDGVADFLINGKTYSIGKHSLIIIGSLERHVMKISKEKYSRYVLMLSEQFCFSHIRDPLLLSVFMHRPSNFQYTMTIPDEESDDIGRLMAIITTECLKRKDLYEQRAGYIISALLVQIYRNQPWNIHYRGDNKTLSVILEVQKYISEHFSQKITLEDISAKFYLSRFYLSRKFKEITGYGFQEYVSLYRVSESKKLLRDTDMEVGEICVFVGYENINHFIQLFKKVEGVTPGKYRHEAMRAFVSEP
jgi:AraC-like DNA-binding protein